MKKYLLMIPSLTTGGAERMVSYYSSELAKNNKKVYILAYFKTNNKYLIDQAVNVIYLVETIEEYNKMSYLKKLCKIRKIIKEIKPDYILPFLPHVNIHAFYSTLFMRKNIIYTVRNNPAKSPSNFFVRCFRNIIFFFSNKIVVQNNDQKKYFPKIIHKKIFIIQNMIPDEFIKSPICLNNLNIYKIISVGRLNSQKNYNMLIESIYLVHKIHHNIILDIYGSGEEEQNLTKKIEELGLSNVVFLKGRSENIVDEYKKHGIFVLSSNFEGMPNTLMEAMGCGLACISTNCKTGPSDLIENNKNGILVDVNNSQQMSNAICYLIDNKKSAQKMAEKAYITIKNNYNTEKIIKDLISICEKRK